MKPSFSYSEVLDNSFAVSTSNMELTNGCGMKALENSSICGIMKNSKQLILLGSFQYYCSLHSPSHQPSQQPRVASLVASLSSTRPLGYFCMLGQATCTRPCSTRLQATCMLGYLYACLGYLQALGSTRLQRLGYYLHAQLLVFSCSSVPKVDRAVPGY